ncbi:BglG family transcription antiterminator [Thalassobacillus sp. B23F22_16]|uniref:BglG family transcription antiterminator n=1 Tax=Thalassobacillus sp. B23F22_16 TaxID=3459513 RepID=UPI00373E4206
MSTSNFSYRQKEIVRYLLNTETVTSYQSIADYFQVSKRTIQREMNNLRPLLAPYHVKLMKKIGSGIYLKGKENDMEQLKDFIEQTETPSTFSPEDRREWMTYDLLLSEEPIKQFTLSKEYNVTEATVSNDLEQVAKFLKHHDITLIRRPGLGVYLKATEYQRRNLLSKLIHKDISFEEWMQLFNQVEKETVLDDMIRARLLKLASASQINIVESIVKNILQHEYKLEMSDKNYVNLIVHLLLAVERIKADQFVTDKDIPAALSVEEDLFGISQLIVDAIEEEFSITVPDIEVDYIALHLAGARVAKYDRVSTDQEELSWVELTEMFINETEKNLQRSLQWDEELREGLIAHFAPAINRLKHGLQIHNPLLERTKQEYGEVFQACRNACKTLEELTDLNIPDSEVGYLTMHMGASLIRMEKQGEKRYRAFVVCASGFGTSTYLASTLQQKMPHISVVDIISIQQLQAMDAHPVDVIISTVTLPMVEENKVVHVSPFFTEDDRENVEAALKKLSTTNTKPAEVHLETRPLAQYGEAMMRILDGLTFVHLSGKEAINLSVLLEEVEDHPYLIDKEIVLTDLARREKLGGFVLDDVAMIHTKSTGLGGLLVSIFLIDQQISWMDDTEAEQMVSTILLLASPKDAPKPHIKMISEISAALADEDFIETIQSHDSARIKAVIEKTLSDSYEEKMRELLKGKQ